MWKLIAVSLVAASLALVGCQPKAPEVPKVAVAPVTVTPAAAPADTRMELEKMGAVKAKEAPKVLAPVTVTAKKSSVKSAATSKPATKSASKKVVARRAVVEGFPTVEAFNKMSAKEQRAYLVAASNEQRADCLRWNLDRKVLVENQNNKGIMDWGNIRTVKGLCEALDVDQMMSTLHPAKVKKAKVKK